MYRSFSLIADIGTTLRLPSSGKETAEICNPVAFVTGSSTKLSRAPLEGRVIVQDFALDKHSSRCMKEYLHKVVDTENRNQLVQSVYHHNGEGRFHHRVWYNCSEP